MMPRASVPDGGAMLLADAAECDMTAFVMAVMVVGACMFVRRRMPWGPVSYTHLTLPTILLV